MGVAELPHLFSGLAIDSASFYAFRQDAFNGGSVGHSNDKLYHVYDELSQTPYHEGLGIRAGVPEQPAGGKRRVTAKSLINHLNWSHRSATPYISLWDDWAKAEKEVERRLEKPEVYSNRTKTSIPRGPVKVAVVSRDRLLQSGVFTFNLEEFLNRPAHKNMLTALRDKKTPISPKEWVVMHRIPDNAVSKVLTFRDPTRPREIVSPRGLSLRQRLKALTLDDYSECNGGSNGHLQAQTQLRWHHVAPHVLKKSFLATDGSVKIPTSKTQRKKQLGGTLIRLRREIPSLFRRDSPSLGKKLYQGLLVIGSMSDPIWTTVAPQKVLKSFQRHVISIYRKTMLKVQPGLVDHNANSQHLAILKEFTSWLIREGTITLLDLEVKGQLMPDFSAGYVDWTIRDDRLHTGPPRP